MTSTTSMGPYSPSNSMRYRPSGKELSKIDSVLPCGLRRFEHTNIITLCDYIEGATQHVVAGELRLIVSQLEG